MFSTSWHAVFADWNSEPHLILVERSKNYRIDWKRKEKVKTRKINSFVDFITRIALNSTILEWCFSSFTRLLNQTKRGRKINNNKSLLNDKRETNGTWTEKYDVSIENIWYSLLPCIEMWQCTMWRIQRWTKMKRKSFKL